MCDLKTRKITQLGMQADRRQVTLKAHMALVQATLSLLGIMPTNPARLIAELREVALARAGLTEADIEAAIVARAQARKAADYDRADALRLEFASKGVAFQDSTMGTTWRPLVVNQTT
jgi:cysteinyl-tRNA synthetase